MSINITKSSDSKSIVSSISSQPRDERGRFASSEVTNLDSASKEVKKQILENARKLNEKEVKRFKSLRMDDIESTAPYIYNFIQ